jgi:hypothetical protein
VAEAVGLGLAFGWAVVVLAAVGDLLHKRCVVFSNEFPCFRPEPVLAKRSFQLSSSNWRKDRFLTAEDSTGHVLLLHTDATVQTKQARG